MDFVSSAIIGGALYDLVSSSVKLTAIYIKAALDNIVYIEDKVASVLAEELSKEQYRNLESEAELITQIDSSRLLQELIIQLNEKSGTVINITANGSGDAFYGDKVIGSKTIYHNK